jgi:LAS superfamily LD-carboxypeptidase LdcB
MSADTIALRAAAQRLIDSISDDESRSGGLISRVSLKRAAELQRILFESRVETIITERAAGRELRPV